MAYATSKQWLGAILNLIIVILMMWRNKKFVDDENEVDSNSAPLKKKDVREKRERYNTGTGTERYK